MATHDYVIANGTGAAVRSDLNGALAAIVSQNSSATEPSPSYAYQRWADTTAGVMKMRNGANNAWITLYQLDGEWSTIAFENGTAAAPSIYFKDSGTDTGIYSPGADQVAISTGGTGRLFVDASGRVALGGTTVTDSNLLNIQGSTATHNVGVVLNKTNGTAQVWGIQNTGSLSFFNYTASSTALTINTSNQVGIGNSDPRGIIHVGTDLANGATDAAAINLKQTSTTAATGIYLERSGARTGYYIHVGGDQDSLTFRRNYAGTKSDVMSLTRDGRVGIGTASPGYQLELSTDSAGKPSSTLWTIVSDERIKEDIELADLDLCYEAIKAIPLKRYKWRDDIYTAEQVTDRRKLGWIAQDVEAIFPKAVGTHEFKYNQVFEETIIPAVEEELDADGNVITPAQPERIEQGDLISEDVIEDCRDLNSDQLYAAMYGAVQKLMAKVETLEASNADMLARLCALEGATG